MLKGVFISTVCQKGTENLLKDNKVIQIKPTTSGVTTEKDYFYAYCVIQWI